MKYIFWSITIYRTNLLSITYEYRRHNDDCRTMFTITLLRKTIKKNGEILEKRPIRNNSQPIALHTDFVGTI